jgi:MYXO-CTERM domain-containing protein
MLCLAPAVMATAAVVGSVGEAAADPTLALVPEALEYTLEQGAGDPLPKTVMLLNLGDGELAALAVPKVTYGAGSGWLEAVAGGVGNRQTVRNTVDVTGLAPNTYTATVELVSEGASGSPKTYTVSLTIEAEPDPTAGPVMVLQPRSVALRATVGKQPSEALVDLTQRGEGDLGAVTTSAQYGASAGWLTVTLGESSGGGRRLRNLASIAGLRPGTYGATVEVSATGAANSPQSYGVSLTVVPAVDDAGIPIDEPAPQADAGAAAGVAERNNLVGGCRTAEPEPRGGWALIALSLGLALATRRRKRRC